MMRQPPPKQRNGHTFGNQGFVVSSEQDRVNWSNLKPEVGFRIAQVPRLAGQTNGSRNAQRLAKPGFFRDQNCVMGVFGLEIGTIVKKQHRVEKWLGFLAYSNSSFCVWCMKHMKQEQIYVDHQVWPDSSFASHVGGTCRWECKSSAAIGSRYLGRWRTLQWTP